MILTQTIIFLFDQYNKSEALTQIYIQNMLKDYVLSFPIPKYKSLIGHSNDDILLLKLSSLRE